MTESVSPFPNSCSQTQLAEREILPLSSEGASSLLVPGGLQRTTELSAHERSF